MPDDGLELTVPNGNAANRVTTLRYHIDEISQREICGWVMDPAQPSRACIVELREGSQVHARTEAKQFRADLANAGIGNGRHAFTLKVPGSLSEDTDHLVQIVEVESNSMLSVERVR